MTRPAHHNDVARNTWTLPVQVMELVESLNESVRATLRVPAYAHRAFAVTLCTIEHFLLHRLRYVRHSRLPPFLICGRDGDTRASSVVTPTCPALVDPSEYIFHVPKPVSDPSLHRGGYAERAMNGEVVVMDTIERNSGAEVVQLA